MLTADVRQALFKYHLIPVAQAIEVILYLNGVFNRRAVSSTAQQAFDALNLASVYVYAPHTRNLDRVTAVLEAWATQLRQVFNDAPVSREFISARFFNTGAKYKANSDASVLIAELQKHLPSMVANLQAAIDYNPVHREAWLSAHVSSASVLTPKNRISKWRTFARHLFWEGSQSIIFGNGKPLPAPGKNVLAHELPRTLAQELWDTAFAELANRERNLEIVDKAEAAAAAEKPIVTPTEPAAPTPTLTRVPAGIRVVSTTDGLLDVEGYFDPMSSLLEPSQRDLLRKKTPPADLSKLLAGQSKSMPAGLTNLATVVAEVAQWMEDQKAQRDVIVQAFERWQEAMAEEARKALKAKLDKHFSKDEQDALASLLKLAPVPAPSAT